MIAFSQACENNKTPILNVLHNAFQHCNQILEIGSGTGQHATYFAEHLTHAQWQPADLAENHESINHRVRAANLGNLRPAITLDLAENLSNLPNYDAVFTANTFHIVSWPLVQEFFNKLIDNAPTLKKVCIYGPFNYQGSYTSDSNRQFDLWLKDRDSQSGIRHFEDVLTLAQNSGLTLSHDHTMPANNRLLEFSVK